jgi:hypothetical protein
LSGQYTIDFLQKCQNNIYSDESGDESDDLTFGVYKQMKKLTYLEKKVKDDFNYFMPVKFENEKEDNLTKESDQELHKHQTKIALAK